MIKSFKKSQFSKIFKTSQAELFDKKLELKSELAEPRLGNNTNIYSFCNLLGRTEKISSGIIISNTLSSKSNTFIIYNTRILIKFKEPVLKFWKKTMEFIRHTLHIFGTVEFF